jgi:hypothetical protein
VLADIVFGACGPAWRFLGTRLDVDLCRRHEQRLVGAYNDELLRQRATGYSAKRRFNDTGSANSRRARSPLSDACIPLGP